MKKKLLTLFMAFCILFILTSTAFAATPPDGVIDTEEELVDAFAEGGDVVIGGNITVTSGLTVPESGSVILDLNGYTVDMVDSSGTTSALITNKGVLTINDSSAAKTGKLSFKTTTPDTNAVPGYASNTITNAGVLTVNGGTIENVSDSGSACYAIDTAWHTKDISTTINGGTITAKEIAIRVVPYSDTATSSLTITDGYISGGTSGVQIFNTSSDPKLVELKISGGELSGTYAFYTSYMGPSAHAGTDIQVDGGTFNGYVFIYNGKNGSADTEFDNVAITGGEFNGGAYIYTTDSEGNESSIPAVSGGTFLGAYAEDVNAYLVNGTKRDANGAVVPADNSVAVIGNIGYTSVQAAIDAAKDGDTVKLISCVELTEGLVVKKKITLDLNGNTIETDIVDSYGTVYVGTAGDLTITDSSTGGAIVNNNGGIVVGNYGKVTIGGGTVTTGNDPENDAALYNFYHNGSTYGTSKITGGTLNGSVWNCGILDITGGTFNNGLDNSGKMTVSGDAVVNGDIIARDGTDAPDLQEKGTLSVSGGTFTDEDVENYLADGYELLSYTDNDGNTVYGVEDEDDVVTVTYKVDGADFKTVKVKVGEDATAPAVPKKDGYVGKWDKSSENITVDTVINAVYTDVSDLVPDDYNKEDKADLENSKAQLEGLLNDNGYTDEDKRAVQAAIDEIDAALESIEKVEEVEDLIGNLPATITKNDETAINAADDGYNDLTDYEKSLVDADAKKALDDAKKALAELKKADEAPKTSDDSHIVLWIALILINSVILIALVNANRKIRHTSKH